MPSLVSLGYLDGRQAAQYDHGGDQKPSGLTYFNPYSEEHMKLYLPEGDHVFRVGFINDDFVKTLADKDLYSDKVNKFINGIYFVGPYPSKVEKESRRRRF